MPPARETCLRFVIRLRHPDSGVQEGILNAAYELCRHPDTSQHVIEQLTVLIDWFKANLPVPRRFSRSRSKGHWRRATAGVCWIKSSAQPQIAKLWELEAVLADNGWVVDVLKSENPGFVVYEVDVQIVAETFADAPGRK